MPEITLTIPSSEWDKFKEDFLTRWPVPTDEAGSPIMSVADHIRICFVEFGKRSVQEGRLKKLRNEVKGNEGIE